MRLTVQDAAELLDVSTKSIYRWIKQGTLPAYRVNDQYRFNRAELLAWATSRKLNVSEDVFHDSLRVSGPIPTLLEAVRAGGIIYRLEGEDKEEAFRHLADSVRLRDEVDRGYLLRLLLARESLGPTGAGDGFGIPQLVYPNALELTQPVIAIAFMERPFDYDALDGKPVGCLLGLFSASLRPYYFLLNRLYYALRDKRTRRVLDEQGSREEILSAFERLESGLRRAEVPA